MNQFYSIKRFCLFLILALLRIVTGYSQLPSENLPLIAGYTRTISGENIPYFSVYRQYAREALLTRCTDGHKIIEWETDTIPVNATGNYAWFTWIAAHSSGTSSGTRYFDLYINDLPVLTFSTVPREYPAWWHFTGPDSTSLLFEFKTRDGANDSHGMAYLRVPLDKYRKGRPLKLKIVGQEQHSNDWFMTFKYIFREKAEVSCLPFIDKDRQQLLQVTVLHFGPASTLQLDIAHALKQELSLKNGFNRFEIPIPAVEIKTKIPVTAKIGGKILLQEEVEIRPVQYRELDLVHHSHTDIGYSHLQEDVIRIHNQNIREALRLISKTKNYPEGSRFIWNIESAWVVENFLRESTSQEREQFFQAVRQGQIVISANYANLMTGLCLPEELDWITDYAVSLRDSFRVPLTAAMLTDVPGMSWPVVSSLAKRGIRYFSNGINYINGMPGGGDRIGQSLSAHGDKPFWWVSASGKDSILMWCAGKGYSSWHGTAPGAVNELGPDKIAAYLRELEDSAYPYDMVQWRYNIVADNGPTDSSICDFVRNWNEKYYSPKLVLANVQELFERFEKKYGPDIPSLRGDFTPYWEDGAYSTAKEEAGNRLTAQRILQLETLAGQHKVQLNPEWLRLAKKFVVLFHEHTWGAYNSISEPDLDFVKKQWAYKKSYADSAIFYTGLLETSLQQQLGEPGYIRVFNTGEIARNGPVEISCPPGFTGNSIRDDSGKESVVQKLANGHLLFWAEQIPAGGERKYQLVNTRKNFPAAMVSSTRISTDTKTGNISSIRALGKEWINTKGKFRGLLQPVYIDGTDPGKFDTARFRSATLIDQGPVLRTQRISWTMKGVKNLDMDITEFARSGDLKITITIDKLPVRSKESVHFAMPFNIPGVTTRIGSGESQYGPGYLQLPGANRDYFSVERWISLGNKVQQVTIVSPQSALYEIGEMINERKDLNGYKTWKTTAGSSSLIFLYAMNNYWHTNFKADQEGTVSFDIWLRFENRPMNPETANRFGRDCTAPLYIIGPGQ